VPARSKFQAEVARIGEGAKFKYVMQLYEQKKDSALAAKEFRAFVARYPKSDARPQGALQRAGDRGQGGRAGRGGCRR